MNSPQVQQNYLRVHRKHRRIVCISESLILLGFPSPLGVYRNSGDH